MDALLTTQGWWTRGPAGYQGPFPAPPAGRPPHRVVVAEIAVWRFAGPPAEAEAEAAQRAGPETLVVLEALGPADTQALTCDRALADRAGAWERVELIAPYPLAVRAALEALGPAPDGLRLVIEPAGPVALLTALDGRAVRAAREVALAGTALDTEVRRTLDSLAEVALAELLAPAEFLEPLAALAAVARPLPGPCLGLAGLTGLPVEAGFLSPAVHLARLARTRRARARRRALAVGAVAAVGGLVTVGILGVEAAATRERAALQARRAALSARARALAPRVLGPRLAPRPLAEAARLAVALPDALGLRELSLQPAPGGGWQVSLVVEPTEEALRAPEVLEAVVRAAVGRGGHGRALTVTPTLLANTTVWRITVALPGREGAP